MSISNVEMMTEEELIKEQKDLFKRFQKITKKNYKKLTTQEKEEMLSISKRFCEIQEELLK